MPKEQYYIEMMDRPWEEYTKPFRHDILRERIRITTECRDCDDLPRVEDAGRCMVDDNGLAVQIMHNGLKVLYGRYYGSWMNRIIADLGGVHEPQEERVFHEVLANLPDGATMVEAGCYWGYYSMWFKSAVPGGKAFLVEPQPNQMRVAQRNFELNGLEGDFTIGYFGSYPEKKKAIQEKRVGEGNLPRFTVGGFMDEKGLERITLLHADIQGHEEEMLETGREELAGRKIDYLFISTHGARHPACREILQSEGYRILAEHSVGQSASVDGLLVAQNPELPEIAPIAVSTTRALVTAHG